MLRYVRSAAHYLNLMQGKPLPLLSRCSHIPPVKVPNPVGIERELPYLIQCLKEHGEQVCRMHVRTLHTDRKVLLYRAYICAVCLHSCRQTRRSFPRMRPSVTREARRALYELVCCYTLPEMWSHLSNIPAVASSTSTDVVMAAKWTDPELVAP